MLFGGIERLSILSLQYNDISQQPFICMIHRYSKKQPIQEEAEVVTSKKRRLFVSEREDGESGDIMPLKFAHIRDSERKV